MRKYMSYKVNFKLQRYKLKIKLHLQKVYKIIKLKYTKLIVNIYNEDVE